MKDELSVVWEAEEMLCSAYVQWAGETGSRFRPMTLTDLRALLAAMPGEQWATTGIVEATAPAPSARAPLYCKVAPDGDRFVLRDATPWKYSGVVCWDGDIGSEHPHATFATRAEAVSFAMAHNIDLAAG